MLQTGESVVTGCQLLSDRPASREPDPLGFGEVAKSLANLILSSHQATPFTLGIQAGWGMGKTSLMRRLREEVKCAGDTRLGEGVVTTIEFNPWSTREGNVLEGLMKSVLNQVRGPLEKALDDENLKKQVRLAGRVALSLVKMRDVADAVWGEVDKDPAALNELRELMSHTMGKARDEVPHRLVCVFVDDLDRCSPRSVFELFEAIKVYLDVDGVAFVIAYDDDVISETILASREYSNKTTAREYLEKIVQVIYPIHRPRENDAARLVDEFIEESGTSDIVGTGAEDIGKWSYQNPRRIKRLINTLIIQHQALSDAEVRPTVAEAAFEMFYGDFVRGRTEPARDLETIRDYAELIEVRDDETPGATQKERISALRRRLKQPDLPLPALLDRVPAELMPYARDWRFLQIGERLGRDDELEEAMHRIGERLPPARARERSVTSEALQQTLEALRKTKFDWRSAEGIATDTGLAVDEVFAVVDAWPQLIREKQSTERPGRRLFQVAERERA